MVNRMVNDRTGSVAGSMFMTNLKYHLSGRSRGFIHRTRVAGRFYMKFC